MELEIEKTYLLKYIPQDLLRFPSKQYLDIYIPESAVHPTLRIRKRGNEYEITKKYPIVDGDASQQHEHTISLDNEEYLAFEAKIRGKRAEKIRFFYKFKRYNTEIDIYQGDLAGLALVDFEFNSKEEMDSFTPPDFCLADVTQEKIMAGGMIVGKTYQEIALRLNKYDYKPIYLPADFII